MVEPVPQTQPKVQIDVYQESSTDCGWQYGVRIHPAEPGHPRDVEVSLSWVDHDHWCGGTLAPSTLLERVLRVLVDVRPARLWPDRFDASTIRRWVPGFDSMLTSSQG